MKKILSLITAAALTLGTTTAFAQENGIQLAAENTAVAYASGETYSDGILKYKELDGTYEVSGVEDVNLTSAVIPAAVNGKSVTSIGDSAFSFTSLTSITIPNSVTSIGEWAFSVTSLTSITIPNSVTSIGDFAFHNCTSLTSVTIPNSVISIGTSAFSGCTSLTSVTIPNSVTRVDPWAFAECTSLTAINVNANNGEYCAVNGVLFNKDKTELVQYPAGKAEKGYTIPNGVTVIGGAAFTKCTSLTSVIIPDSVTSIGDSAFSSTSLTSITIPNSVTSIGDSAFSFTSLTSITIPNSVTSIDDFAFDNCTSLTSVTIPNSVTSIGSCAFFGCKSLTSVTIPNSVTSIGDSAFFGCKSLTSVTIPSSVTRIGDGAFGDCPSLKNVYYSGTEEEWNEIYILVDDNDSLFNATIHYNSTGSTGTPVDIAIEAPTGVDTSNQTATVTVNGETKTLPITDGLLDVSGLEEGKTYTFTFLAKNCAPRAYSNITVTNGTATGLPKVELNLYGDINGDGKLTLGDVLKANAAARNSKPLTGYEANVADINGDGNITLGDVLKMNAHARKSKLLW